MHLGLLVFSGFAAGVLLSAPMEQVSGTAIPVGKDVFGALPRILAAVGSSVAAAVIVAGAVLSAVRYGRDRAPGHARMAAANALIAAGTLVLSSGGLVQGAIGHDEAFTLSLAIGITVIYAGFVLAGSGREARPQRPPRSPMAALIRETSSHGPSRNTNWASGGAQDQDQQDHDHDGRAAASPWSTRCLRLRAVRFRRPPARA